MIKIKPMIYRKVTFDNGKTALFMCDDFKEGLYVTELQKKAKGEGVIEKIELNENSFWQLMNKHVDKFKINN